MYLVIIKVRGILLLQENIITSEASGACAYNGHKMIMENNYLITTIKSKIYLVHLFQIDANQT